MARDFGAESPFPFGECSYEEFVLADCDAALPCVGKVSFPQNILVSCDAPFGDGGLAGGLPVAVRSGGLRPLGEAWKKNYR